MIQQIRIQNFKSISDVTVELSPLTVLVGRSGTGKTNFVTSLQFLRDLLVYGNQGRPLKNEWPSLRPAVDNGLTSISVEFSIAGVAESYSYSVTVALEGPESSPFAECLSFGSQTLFSQGASARHKPEWITEPALVDVPEPGALAIGRLASIPEVVVAYTALTEGIGCYGFSDQVLSVPGLAIGRRMHSPTDLPAKTAGLDDSASNYLESMQDIVRNLREIEVRKGMVESLRRVNPTITSVELNNLQQPTHVVVGHKYNGKTLALRLSQESAGFRRFFAHLLALYQSPPKQTLIFEHPEDGIHPGALSLLAEEFQSAPSQGRGQIMLTTHSPKLLDHFSPEQIRVVELDGLQTRIGPVSSEQRDAIDENLLDAGELLTVDPARVQTISEASEA